MTEQSLRVADAVAWDLTRSMPAAVEVDTDSDGAVLRQVTWNGDALVALTLSGEAG